MTTQYGVFTTQDAKRIAEAVRRWGPKIPPAHKTRPRKRRGVSGDVTAAPLIPVDMIVSGGLDGTETIRASWRYTVYRLGTGEVLRGDVDPNDAVHRSRIRGTIGSVVPADFGLAYYNESSELIVCYCNETRADEACP